MATREPAGASGSSGDETRPANILVVEDEQIVTLELKERLARMGHRVVGAVGSGEEAVAEARRLLPDLVLMDIKLQGEMDGIQAAEAIRRESDIPIVYLTAFADNATTRRAKHTEPYGYILKPFQERELHVVIDMALYRHRAARALRENEAWRRALLESVGDAVVATDAEDRVKFLNPLAEALTGWKEPEAIGRPVQEVFRVLEEPQAGAWHGAPAKVLVSRAGARCPIDLERTTIQHPGEADAGTVLVFRDVSERKRFEERQHFMTEASGQVAASLDREMILGNLAALIAGRLADWCVIHLCEEGRFRIAALAHRDREKSALAARLKGRLCDPAELREVASRGRSILESAVPGDAAALGIDIPLDAASLAIVPLVARGAALGTLTLAAERRSRAFTESDLAFMEELARRMAAGLDNARLFSEAQRAIRTREDVLAIVSHDLRNPLTSIVMNADQLLRSPEKNTIERVAGSARLIRSAAERMTRMVNDLLDVARIDSERLLLDLETTEVNSLIAEALAMFEGIASQRSIRLGCGALPRAQLRCDRDRILQVLSNLIGNALKFSPAGSSVVIGGRVDDGLMTVSVEDQGRGIAPDQKALVFERYWQAPESVRKGSGLGLYIAKGIVEAHGGRIWFDSEPGVGTTFYFTVPLARSVDVRAPSP